MTRPCLRCERALAYAEWERPVTPMCAACISAMYAASSDALRGHAAQLRRMADVARLDGRDDLVQRFGKLADVDELHARERR